MPSFYLCCFQPGSISALESVRGIYGWGIVPVFSWARDWVPLPWDGFYGRFFACFGGFSVCLGGFGKNFSKKPKKL